MYTQSITEIIETALINIKPLRLLKKIKVKSCFYEYLVANFTYDIVHTKDDSPRGYYSAWTGIPIEIDDTIENEYYELVYEENKNDLQKY